MKLGEVKIEALKLMFANAEEDIVPEYLSKYEHSETYRSYLLNIVGSINRCFSSIEEKRVLTPRSHVLSRLEGVATAHYIRFDLPSILADYYDVDRVVCEDNGDYNGDCQYFLEGDTLVVPFYEESDNIVYTVVYHPSIQRVTALTDNNTELTIPNSIATYIPYFIKGDLYLEDEPGEATAARNMYEVAMDEMQTKKASKTGGVKTIYSQTE